ncbi:MAG: RagB/SusD family nutrient uptake outer membrane protein [Prevotella sp.]|nr:RagB/SusD family nutrient uptake outer membrane protein [Prevotella sp.]
MKKILYTIVAIAFLSITACDDYIDITPTGRITVDSTYQYYELVALPNRAYYSVPFDMLTDNSWIKESNVIGYENLNWNGINTTFNESADRLVLPNNQIYANCYQYILRQNIVLSEIDNSIGSDEIKNLAKAEARIFRAWDHFVLVNTYAKAYNPQTAASDGGVPVIKEYNLEARTGKSSVAEVYDFIIKEIDEALPLLQEKPLNEYHPSKAFGYALKALVRLFHHDWQEAKEAAEQSLALKSDLIDYIELEKNGGPTKQYQGAYTYGKGNNPELLSYMSVSSATENLTYTPGGLISPELVQLFEENEDLRFTLFFNKSGNAYYYDAGSGAALWNSSITYSKFYYGTVSLRTAEMYLILAECQARLGDINGAMTTLNKLREKRIKNFDPSKFTASNTQDMMEQIINERRKELLFGFHRFWDLKRLNTEPEYAKTIVRTFPIVSTEVEHKTYTLRPDSRLYIIPFPENAISLNPNLTQNTDE